MRSPATAQLARLEPQKIALNAEGVPSDWIMLVPGREGASIKTQDGRGPYKIADAAKLIAATMAADDRLAIDENHSTDLSAPKGGPSPARGWVVELQAREDGLWGRVEWSKAGQSLLADKEYRFISPVFLHSQDGTIVRLLRASLTNRPNLRGMAALHSETSMDFMAQLRQALGLPEDAAEEAILAEVKKWGEKAAGKTGDGAAAVQSALAPIAKAAGLLEGAGASTIVAAIQSMSKGGGDGNVIASLQSELANVTTKLNAVTEATAKDKATAFVDGAIKAGAVGVKPMRDHYIAQHAIDPARVEKEIDAMPRLTPGGGSSFETPAKDKDGKPSLNSEQRAAARALGVAPEEYAKTLAAEAAEEGAY